jgi:hypothetical protein
MGLGLAAGAMIAALGLYWGLQAVLFIQYRFQLENDSYELSREIVQRTRELQNLFTTARAMADQAETQFANDGKAWGQRALYLTRLTMWLGARMEYLEKHVQMELWRVRRERYWMRWAQRIMTPLVLIAGLVVLALEPAPETGEVGFRARRRPRSRTSWASMAGSATPRWTSTTPSPTRCGATRSGWSNTGR